MIQIEPVFCIPAWFSALGGAMDRAGEEDDHDYGETEESEESPVTDDDTTWIQWFSGLKGNELFCEVRCCSGKCAKTRAPAPRALTPLPAALPPLP